MRSLIVAQVDCAAHHFVKEEEEMGVVPCGLSFKPSIPTGREVARGRPVRQPGTPSRLGGEELGAVSHCNPCAHFLLLGENLGGGAVLVDGPSYAHPREEEELRDGPVGPPISPGVMFLDCLVHNHP